MIRVIYVGTPRKRKHLLSVHVGSNGRRAIYVVYILLIDDTVLAEPDESTITFIFRRIFFRLVRRVARLYCVFRSKGPKGPS